jgi:HAD superfamily hydrolase (TIGR01509 family)
MTHIRAVAFDLDGLMFDTEALFFTVAGEMLAIRGKAFTPEIMAAMIGRQAVVAYPALKAMADLEETPDELLAEARARFYERIDTAVHPTSGLFALLSQLEHAGIPRAVCTSSRRSYAERLLGNHGLIHHFAFLLCAEDVTHSKPNPEIYLKAAQRFGIAPGEMLVLEDSPAGLAAGKAAGAFVVAIPHEHCPASTQGDANLIAERLDDPRILDLLKA